jgi:trehalose 6-phosphate synthase
MNLVAKEYVAAQDPENPGALVLSQFAGAAEELEGGAIFVNPHEPEAMAAAIDTALQMPLDERRDRHRRMYRHLAANDIDHWAECFLAALAESQQHRGLFDNLRQLFSARG